MELIEVFLGIDPGSSGGIAVIGEGITEAWRYPKDLAEAAKMLVELNRRYRIKLAAEEKVSAMPGNGVSGMFKFGGNFYGWQWAMSALGIPYVLVTPRQWQKELLDAGTGETKERSLSMARRLFPDVDLRYKADDGKADALHLARWAMKMCGRTPAAPKSKMTRKRRSGK